MNVKKKINKKQTHEVHLLNIKRLVNIVYDMAEHQNAFYKQRKWGNKTNTRQLNDEFVKATIPKIFRGYSIVILNM